MLKVGELFASIKLDNKDFNRDVDASGNRFSSMGAGVARTGVMIVGALTTATAAGGAAFLHLGGMAGDLNETISKVRVVFGDLGDEMLAWSADSATALGMSQAAALAATGTYGNLFRAMGIGERESADMSQGLVELGADLASFNNMDPTEVLDKLRAGLSGETEPLRSLGVNLTAARIEAKAMEMGLADANGELSAAAKAQATYALILEDTSLAQGDFERTSGGMANQQRILAATMEDTFTKLGQAAVPIIEAILPQLVGAFQGLADWVGENSEAIGEGVSGALAVIGDIMTFLIENVLPALVEAFVFIGSEVIPVLVDAITWLAENVLPGLVAVFETVVGWVSDNWPTISSIFEQVFGAIGSIIETVWPIIEAIASVLFPAVGAAASVLFNALDGYFKLIGGVFEVAGTVAKTVFDAIVAVWETLGDVFEGIWDAVGGSVKGGLNFLIGLVNNVIGFINGLQISIPSIDIPFVGKVGGFTIGMPDIPTIPRLAGGGRILGAGMAIVGEQGPELMHMRAGAEVMSNQQLMAMLGGGGGPREVHYHRHFEPDIDIEAPEREPFTRDDVVEILQDLSRLEGI